MTAEDYVLMGVLAVLSGTVAYALGRRNASDAPARSESVTPAAPAARAESPRAPQKPAPATPAPSPSRPAARPATAAPARLTPPAASLVEEDDTVDPTMIGAAANLGIATRVVYQPPLKCIAYDADADREDPPQAESVFLVHATAQTDTGLRRKRNEDSVLALSEENVFVIADGMGGHKGGHLASQMAVQTIASAFRSREFEGPPHEGVPGDVTDLARAIQMANAAILELATENPDLEGMGTTVCAARFSPNRRRLYVGHVGDSRCYALRDGVLRQMTADHTMADYGVTGPESSQLSRAVGIWPTVPIDIVTAVPSLGDVYLLCSDGLTKMVSDELIAEILNAIDDPKAAVEELIVQANARGGKDNITVILVRVVPPNWTPTRSQR